MCGQSKELGSSAEGGRAGGLPSVQGCALGMDGQEDISTEDRAGGEQ